MELRFALLADAAVPVEGGKFNLIGAGVEAIFTPSVPAVHSVLTLAAKVNLTRDEAREPHTIDVTFTGPDGTQLASGSASVTAFDEEGWARLGEDDLVGAPMLLAMPNIVLPAFGTYELAMRWDNAPLTTLPLRVARLPEE